ESGPREKIATFIVDADNADAYSGEPIYCNGELAGYVTSGGFGYRVEKSLALGYLSAEFHKPENHFEIEILGDMRPAEMTDGPVYDPTGLRMKA
ncbi:MAG: aminomethyl transferase family protein, partial [Gammaproteobacteria bacterium]|nr:aminomethyl transferase family protein [Gammaproteobacteria bacterium]